MRLLWIAIVLTLFQCNYGQVEEESTVSEDLIDDVFNRDKKPGNDVTEGSSSGPPPPPSEKPKGVEPTCSTCTPTADDPILTPKSSNVSQSCVNNNHHQSNQSGIFKCLLLLLLCQ